jgi:hypothetical protein
MRYEEILRNKKKAFEQESNTKKAVHLTMIQTQTDESHSGVRFFRE